MYRQTLEAFAGAANGGTAGRKTLWDSEFHWNFNTEEGDLPSNEIPYAARALISLFDHFDTDFTGTVWWDLNHPGVKEPTPEIRSDLVRSTTDAFQIQVTDYDGSSTMQLQSLSIRAFRSGPDAVVWAINGSNVSKARDLVLQNTTLSASANATISQWTASSQPIARKLVPRNQTLVMPPMSITYVRIPNAYP